MKRVAFTMKLKPGCENEYKRRHDEIWPELVREFETAGIQDYSIYLDPDSLILFAVQKVKDHNTVADLSRSRVVKKWWKHMADIMDTNEDNSPVVRNLLELFHMD